MTIYLSKLEPLYFIRYSLPTSRAPVAQSVDQGLRVRNPDSAIFFPTFDENQCDNINPSLTNRFILCEKAVSGLERMLDICQDTWVGALSAEIY